MLSYPAAIHLSTRSPNRLAGLIRATALGAVPDCGAFTRAGKPTRSPTTA